MSKLINRMNLIVITEDPHIYIADGKTEIQQATVAALTKTTLSSSPECCVRLGLKATVLWLGKKKNHIFI